MRIRWLGHSAFLLMGDSVRVAIDPFGKLPAGGSVRFDYPPLEGIEAGLVLISHEHFDHNAAEAIGGDPQVIRARAGTFESPVGDVVGIASEHDPRAGTQRGMNAIFRFTLDGVRCCHLGDFGQSALRPEQREEIGPVDALFIPVGAGPTIGGVQAAEVVRQLRPRLVVPMHFATEAVDFLEPLDEFLAAVSAQVRHLDTNEIEAEEVIGSEDEPAVVALKPPVTPGAGG